MKRRIVSATLSVSQFNFSHWQGIEMVAGLSSRYLFPTGSIKIYCVEFVVGTLVILFSRRPMPGACSKEDGVQIIPWTHSHRECPL